MECGIYTIVCITSGRVYVGSAVNIKKRWQLHVYSLRKGSHHSRHLQRAWDKYGEANFTFSVIEPVNNKTQLIDREQAWIEELNAYTLGFNSRPKAGSQLGMKHTERTKELLRSQRIGRKRSPHTNEAKLKISIAHKGLRASPEARAKLSAARRKRIMPPVSDETKKRISQALTGRKCRPRTPEERKRCGLINKGKQLTAEHRQRISATNKGMRSSMTGKKHSAETKLLMSILAKQRKQRKHSINDEDSISSIDSPAGDKSV